MRGAVLLLAALGAVAAGALDLRHSDDPLRDLKAAAEAAAEGGDEPSSTEIAAQLEYQTWVMSESKSVRSFEPWCRLTHGTHA